MIVIGWLFHDSYWMSFHDSYWMSSSRRKKLNRKKIEIKNGIIFLMDRNCNSLKDRGIRVQEDVYEYDKHTVRYLS